MQTPNFIREFKILKMKEYESLKKYIDRLLTIVNKIKMLGVELSNKRVVEKVLVSLLERSKLKIPSL